MMLRTLPYLLPRHAIISSRYADSHYLLSLQLALLAVVQDSQSNRALSQAIMTQVASLNQFIVPREQDGSVNPIYVASKLLETVACPKLYLGLPDGSPPSARDIHELAVKSSFYYELAPSDISVGAGDEFSTTLENRGRDLSLFKQGKSPHDLLLFQFSELNSDAKVCWEAFCDTSKHQPAWKFWREWYRGFLDGQPLDWELQRRVALIDEPVWFQGPEAVAAEIERIHSHYKLELELAHLKEHLAAVERTPVTAQIGDNGGPPLEDAAAGALQTDLALIWKQVEELEEEIAKPSPSPSLLEKIARTLWEISLRMTSYCGSVADGMIREGSKELAKAGAKWTARATAVTATAQTESVQSVAKAIWAFVKTLQ